MVEAKAAAKEIEEFTGEFKSAARRCFQLIDKDQGGTLSHSEIVEAVKSDKEVIKFLTTCGDENLSFLLHPPRLKKALEAANKCGLLPQEAPFFKALQVYMPLPPPVCEDNITLSVSAGSVLVSAAIRSDDPSTAEQVSEAALQLMAKRTNDRSLTVAEACRTSPHCLTEAVISPHELSLIHI